MTRYICIHGHFYQPPRECPWSGEIGIQPSAAPFPDWNHRIAKECYRANAGAAILDEAGNVTERVNNYDSLSFNFGPTLLSWMDENAGELARLLVQADKSSIARCGHGTAMAQAYHHPILPLCSERDKETEVRWGVADFVHRFGRRPEGMWLPETAADLESLDVLAGQGMTFAVLAPRQARAVRDIGGDWQGVDEDSVDPSRAYRVSLPSGRSIAVFFYDGDLAMEVAFRGALDNGERFAHRLREAALSVPEGRLTHFATDGESYGHHHRYGEMALAFCIRTLREFDDVELTSYAAYLAAHPPEMEARIHAPSSWSCVHGVGRWSENCGCVIDPAKKGEQEWRPVLRSALERLRDSLSDAYEHRAGALVRDPWELRHRWKEMELAGQTRELLQELAFRPLSEEDELALRKLVEIQRLALMMFTSCGWFFDDAHGLEPVQLLRYARRAIDLHREATGENFESGFLETFQEFQGYGEGRPGGLEVWNSLALPPEERRKT